MPRIGSASSLPPQRSAPRWGGAARADEVQQVHVKYADLNLGTITGATALYQRIRRAANEVCPATDDRELAAKAPAIACADQAVARAVATVDNVNLTQVYEAELGTTVGIVRSRGADEEGACPHGRHAAPPSRPA